MHARPVLSLLLLLHTLVALAGPALASDGVLEINQVCAENDGCFAGDPQGFPVVISAPGSYRLTSELVPTSENDDAIEIAAGVTIVTLDLNGFRIAGTDSGTGIGVRGGGGASAITIRNGTVAFMGGDGINIGGSAVIESVHTLGNNGDGFDVNQTSLVRDCRIVGNSQFGINFSDSSSLYSGNVFSSNGSGPVNLGSAGESNLCGGTICSAFPRRRFYLTQGTFNGQQAGQLGVCAAGFHFASLWEILDPSQLQYDTDLGFVRVDSGSGPPSGVGGGPGSEAFGWVRTGFDSSELTTDGRGNCLAYSSSLAAAGTVAWLHDDWDAGTSNAASIGPGTGPWVSDLSICSTPRRLWCVED